ncbi:MAG: AraC family transcriptional regulator [Pleomorphochaeta sp.]
MIEKDTLKKLILSLDNKNKTEGIKKTYCKEINLGRTSKAMPSSPEFNEPGILFVANGEKKCNVGDKEYIYGSGDFLITLLPMPVFGEISKASSTNPFMAIGIKIDTNRLAKIENKINQTEGPYLKNFNTNPSGIIASSASEKLLDTMIRLIDIVCNPNDFSVLGEGILDELYYRILCDSTGGNIRALLKNRNQVKQISNAVSYIHNNIEKQISVDELADLVFMSRTAFYTAFKKIMHVSPLQYTKSVKLSKANILLSEGKKTNEAGYLVGYNSPAQFSREYKRYFGINPSEIRQKI